MDEMKCCQPSSFGHFQWRSKTPRTIKPSRTSSFVAEVGVGDGLSSGQSDAVGGTAGGGGLNITAGGENLSNEVSSSRQSGEAVVAIGVGHGFEVADLEDAGVGQININRGVGDSEFAAVLHAVAVGVVENRAGDGAQHR